MINEASPQHVVADSDGDGLTDDVDACPVAFGTGNGCPPPADPPPVTVDSDGDAVTDERDACPYDSTNGCLVIETPPDVEPVSVENGQDELVDLEAVQPPIDEGVAPEFAADDEVTGLEGDNAEAESPPLTEEEVVILLEDAAESDIEIKVELNGDDVDVATLSIDEATEALSGADPYFFNPITMLWEGWAPLGGTCPDIVLAANCTNTLTPLSDAITAVGALGALPPETSVEIFVENGTYAETLPPITTANVILRGVQAGQAIINGGITVSADNVTIRDLVLQNTIDPGGAAVTVTAGFNGVQILNNIIEQANNGVTIDAGATATRIEGNTFQNLGNRGVNSNTTAGTVVNNNVFTNVAESAIQDTGSTGLQITNNTITDDLTNLFAGFDTQKELIDLNGGSQGVVSDNLLQVSGTLPTTHTVVGMDITPPAAGGTLIINGNILDGGDVYVLPDQTVGIQLNAGGANTVSITSNQITGWATGILANAGGAGSVVNLSQNSIAGNSVGVRNLDAAVLDADFNWWGCPTGADSPGCDTTTPLGAVTSFPFLTTQPPAPIAGASAVPPTTSGGGTGGGGAGGGGGVAESQPVVQTTESTGPPLLSDNPVFAAFQLPSRDVQLFLINSRSEGEFFALYEAAQLAFFMQSNPFASLTNPVVFDVRSGPGGTVRLSYIGNSEWLVEIFRGGVLIQQDIIRTDPILQFLRVGLPIQPTSQFQGVFVVRPGDNLTRIGRLFGVSVASLVRANGIANPNLIFSGQQLLIPQPNPQLSIPGFNVFVF